MARVATNSILQGLSGMIGGQFVFKQYQDKTVVCVKPRRCRKKTSELQQLYLQRFAEASKYARVLLRDPDKKEYYTKLAKKHRKRCAYNLIISEYMLFISVEKKKQHRRKVIKNASSLGLPKRIITRSTKSMYSFSRHPAKRWL